MTIKNQKLENIMNNEERQQGYEPRLIKAYEYSKRKKLEMLDFDEGTCRIEDFEKLSQNMNDLEINEFTISDRSIYLIEILKDLESVGFKMEKVIEIPTGNKGYNEETDEEYTITKPALLIKRA